MRHNTHSRGQEQIKDRPRQSALLLFWQRNQRMLIIIAITALIHVIVLFAVTFNSGSRQKRADNTIFKIVNVKEFIPAPEKPKKEIKKEDVVEIQKQDEVVEDVIETDKEVKELDIEYLPQHKISEMPKLPFNQISSRKVYPPLARKQGIEGVVYLQLFIDHKGVIQKIFILKEPGFGFGKAAVKALQGIKCIPAKSNGIAVAVKMVYPVRFKLK